MKMLRTNFLKVSVAAFFIVHCNATRDNKNDPEKRVTQDRHLSENGTDSCELCAVWGGTLLGDVYPEDLGEATDLIPPGLNCTEIADFIRSKGTGESAEECENYIRAVTFSLPCCSFPVSSTTCEQEVQSTLLGDDSSYSANVEPVPMNEPALDVSLVFTYYALTGISTVEGTADLFLGIITYWTDNRLTWDPKDVGGCFYTSFRASIDPELTDIWVPPLDLANRVESLQDLPEAFGLVTYDGQVQWFRFGRMKALCFFDGLESFPYDTLKCDFHFTSTLRYSRVNFNLAKEEIIFDENDRKYQEFKVIPEKATVEIKGNDIFCTFYFKRSSRYYNNKIVIPTILFTILTFGVFLLDQRVGERLGFGVSVLLVIVAQAILTSDILPVTEETLWVNFLTQGSQYFAIAAVLESLFVAYLHYVAVEPMAIDEASSEDKPTADEFGENKGERISFLDSQSNGDEFNMNVRSANGPEDANTTPKKASIMSRMRNFKWDAKSIATLDKVCLIVFPISYLIFVVVMFATNKNFVK